MRGLYPPLAENLVDSPRRRFLVLGEAVTLGTRPFTFYEFFAGAGLARLGLGESWSCTWANDIDPKKAQVYAMNFGVEDFQLGDVANVDAGALPSGADMAWASFPCQDLSLAGWRRGMSAKRSGAFWGFWRVMRDLADRGDRPPIIVLENVAGLLYDRTSFVGLCEALAALGMQFGALVIDAKHFLPQSRPRVFVIGVDARVDCVGLADALPWGGPLFPQSIFTAFGALPEALHEFWRWWFLPAPGTAVGSLVSVIESEPTGVQWRTHEETDRLLSLMTPLNRNKVEVLRSNGLKAIGMLYRRTREGRQRPEVRFDGIAGCLRTPNGGSSRQTVVIVEEHRVRSRLLSPREAARLMGVPDSYLLPDSYNDAYRAMGDGVAVPVVSWLSKHLLTLLAERCALTSQSTRIRGDMPEHTTIPRQNAEALAASWGALRR